MLVLRFGPVCVFHLCPLCGTEPALASPMLLCRGTSGPVALPSASPGLLPGESRSPALVQVVLQQGPEPHAHLVSCVLGVPRQQVPCMALIPD